MTDSSARATELLARMTLEEKVAQLTSIVPTVLFDKEGLRQDVASDRLGQGIGYLEPHLGGFPARAAELARLNNLTQKYLVEQTRLGIPATMHVEALNGINGPTFTAFPTAIGLAATWDPAAVQRMTDLVRRQMRSAGLHHALSPVLDIARDARWGRVHETYGEDPYLTTAFGVAFVRGLQGDSLRDGVIATGKHFLGYAVTEGGLNSAVSRVGRRELLEVYARPFHAAIHLAGMRSTMNSLSEWDGVPAAADPRLLRDLLRDQLGFDGAVVADWSSVANLVGHHRVAVDAEDAAVLALQAGIDVELPEPFAFGAPLIAAVRSGKAEEDLVDESVLRVLRDKFDLGLFEDPYVPEGPIELTELATAGSDLSLTLARQSVTLLRDADGVLPLQRRPLKVALIGPHATIVDAAFPAYTFPSFIDLTRSMLAGIESSMVGVEGIGTFGPDQAYIDQEIGDLLRMSSEEYVRTAYGARSLADWLQQLAPQLELTVVPGCGLVDGDEDLEAAAAAASAADVVLLALGGQARWFFAERTEGEGADTGDLRLPAAQRRLVRAVAEVGRPTATVIFSGRPFALGDVEADLGAILFGYFGGPHGTRAVAEVLLGLQEPVGRLPYTVPRTSGQVPIHAGQHSGSGYRRPAGDPMGGYTDAPATPLFAFGHGAGYTTFDFSDLAVSASSAAADGTLRVEGTVRNTGGRAGTAVAQLYVEDVAVAVTRPALQLVGFQRVELAPGAAARVRFELQLPMLAYLGRTEEWTLEAGPIRILLGRSSDDLPLQTEVLVRDTARFPARPPVFLSVADVEVL